MIDLGLAKLAIIGTVALVVIGPEKLPKVARMAGSLLGRAQRYLNQVKAEVSREMELEQLRQMQTDVEHAAQEIKAGVESELAHAENSLKSALQDPANRPLPEQEAIARKAREFRRKKILKNAAVPGWYKQQHGQRAQLLSAAARVARYRPKPVSR